LNLNRFKMYLNRAPSRVASSSSLVTSGVLSLTENNPDGRDDNLCVEALANGRREITGVTGKKKNTEGTDVALAMSSEPSSKKHKIDFLGDMLPNLPSSFTLPSGFDRTSQAKRSMQESSLLVQKSFREKQILEEEFSENQELLIIYQARLRRLEREYRVLQERQLYRPSEEWLSERIIREHEIIQNQELFNVQKQRCRRLNVSLEVNDRRILEQQMMLEKEIWQNEAVGNISPAEFALKDSFCGKNKEEQQLASKEWEQNKVTAPVSRDINSLQRILTAQEVVCQERAFESELKRQTLFEQQDAMHQTVTYRLAMQQAMKRKAKVQEAMKERLLMMRQNTPDLPQRSVDTSSLPEKWPNISEEMPQNMNPTETKSMDDKNSASMDKNEGDHDNIMATLGRNYESQGIVPDEDDDEDDDDGSIII